MIRIYAALTITFFAFIFAGCSKDYTGSESDLYGTWTKGTNFGDTLWFMKKNNQNIMRYNGFGTTALTEVGYRYKNGKLSLKLYAPQTPDYYPITSFTWVQPGNEFKIQGIQLFMFMSSTNTYFTYRKL